VSDDEDGATFDPALLKCPYCNVDMLPIAALSTATVYMAPHNACEACERRLRTYKAAHSTQTMCLEDE